MFRQKTKLFETKMMNHLNDMKHTLRIVVIILVFTIIPFAALIIGGMRMNECPIEKRIPIWLLISGLVAIMTSSILITIVKFLCFYNIGSVAT